MNAYQNLLQADRSYMQTDAAFAGWVLIHLATMLYYKLSSIIKARRKSSILSSKDLLIRLSRVFHLHIGIRVGSSWSFPFIEKNF